jgi:DNA-directed RNA polymerase subunit RPC12/RpoP
MVHFLCSHCGAKLKVPQAHAGKTGRCPHCQGKITVPPMPVPEVPTPRPVPKPTDSADPAYDAALLDLSHKDRVSNEATSRSHLLDESGEESAPSDGSRLPWPIDIFLYPLDLAGIIHLVSLWLLVFLLCPFIMGFLGLGTEFAPIVYTLPVAWWWRNTETAPAAFPNVWFRPVFRICGRVARSGRCRIYIVREQRRYGNRRLFFPMVLLTAVVFDSYDALNPLLILGSILRTFLPYCGLVLLLTGGAWLLVKMNFRFYSFRSLPTGPFFIRAAQLYLLFVAVGLLGRFYQRHKKRLDWGI